MIPSIFTNALAVIPRVDGLTLCERVRADMDTPIVVLTARASKDDLLGLDLGADDYITKPLSPASWWSASRPPAQRLGEHQEHVDIGAEQSHLWPVRAYTPSP